MNDEDYRYGWNKGFWEGRLDMMIKVHDILIESEDAEARIANIKKLIDETRRELYSI